MVFEDEIRKVLAGPGCISAQFFRDQASDQIPECRDEILGKPFCGVFGKAVDFFGKRHGIVLYM